MSDEKLSLVEIAKELDAMERSVTSWEASFLDSILTRLSRGYPLSDKQEKVLREMHGKYLGDGTEETQEEVDD